MSYIRQGDCLGWPESCIYGVHTIRYFWQGNHEIYRADQNHIYTVYIRYFWQGNHQIYRAGQNHIYTVYIRYFWQGNHQIYGVYVRIYTVLANPRNIRCI